MSISSLNAANANSSKVFYFVGASGAGKDSVLDALRPQLNADFPLLIAHRYITRPAEYGGENHISLTEDDFHLRQKSGLFAMHWQANDCLYAVDNEINNWLEKGFSVLFNGSRAQIEQAKKVFGERLRVISLQVDHDVLAARLMARGRESEVEIQARLVRHLQFNYDAKNDGWCLDNNGALQDTVDSLQAYLQQQMGE